MEQQIKKIERSVKIYPILSSFTADLIFFIPIDTLFLTLVKGLSASQITAMTMVSMLICIVFRTLILKVAKKIGNINSLKLGTFLILISSTILTFGKSFISMLVYRSAFEIAFMFLNMDKILLKNNLNALNKEEDYYKIRNRSKIMYAIITMITALLSGYLFNLNNYLPMYLSIIIYIIMLVLTFIYYEANTNINKEKEIKKDSKLKITSIIFLALLSNTVFVSIIKMGQNNSKLFMQYDFQKVLSLEMVTYYMSSIVFISRIARLVGNVIFGKIYLKMKDKISIILTIFLSMAFLLLIIGHLINVPFIYKVIIMSVGFFLILATRDSFQVYIEDVALNFTNKEEQQKVMVNIELSRKLGTLILSAIFTLILTKYELIVIEFILLILAIIEIFINKRLYSKLKEIN